MADAPNSPALPPTAALHITPSPLLQLPGAVAGGGSDAPVAWHYGDPTGEQRAAEGAAGLIDRSHREVVVVAGPDRHDWLNKLTSQLLLPLADGAATEALILSPNGHVEHHFGVTEVGGVTYLDTDPGRAAALVKYLEMMKFWTDVTIEHSPLRELSLLGPKVPGVLTAAGLPLPPLNSAAVHQAGFIRHTAVGFDLFVAEDEVAATARVLIGAGARPTGSWADDALRVAARRPRIGVDTDEKTIPNEVGWLGVAVHLHKGCYRGQETVARVANLGRPPRRLVLLNLDGSQDVLPAAGEAVTTTEGRVVGRIGTVAQHHEDGPIALALVKRNIGPDVVLLAGGVDARVDPADAVIDEGKPVSAVDRAAFANIRRN